MGSGGPLFELREGGKSSIPKVCQYHIRPVNIEGGGGAVCCPRLDSYARGPTPPLPSLGGQFAFRRFTGTSTYLHVGNSDLTSPRHRSFSFPLLFVPGTPAKAAGAGTGVSADPGLPPLPSGWACDHHGTEWRRKPFDRPATPLGTPFSSSPSMPSMSSIPLRCYVSFPLSPPPRHSGVGRHDVFGSYRVSSEGPTGNNLMQVTRPHTRPRQPSSHVLTDSDDGPPTPPAPPTLC